MNKYMKEELIGSSRLGGHHFALALGAIFAHKLGYIDRDTVIRVVIGPTGLWIAWYGNRMPKAMVEVRVARARQARRVAGWSLVLSGLVYAGLWAFAPIPVAITVGSRRGLGRDSGDARLLPVAAGQGESRLIQAFFEARQPRWQKVPDPAVKSHPGESSHDNQSSALHASGLRSGSRQCG